MKNILLTKLQLGDIELNNRIIMAPLTRQRSGKARIPNKLMATYYSQRATAGLIISEATSITPMGVGYKDTPGIWNKEQVEGWKLITKAVHEKQGKIFSQLWHVGRISHPLFLNGEIPVSPSSIKPMGHVSLVRPKTEFIAPRALETREIKNLLIKYRDAAKNAMEAGFDGVELHAANGYLIDQFLQSSTNKRTDEYGGNLENRARFLLEIVDVVSEVCGAGKVGVHLAPACDTHDMADDNPKETFVHIAKELGKRKIAFIFLREPKSDNYLTPLLKEKFGGVVIANQSLSVEQAVQMIQEEKADAASWGRYYISNPDLVQKIEKNEELTAFNPETFYTEGSEGYTSY